MARVLRARDPRIFVRFFTTAFASFTARRIRGLAPATFSVNAFCTDPAFAAIVPSVVPMDSATLVRMASSFAVLRLSMAKPRFSHQQIAVVRQRTYESIRLNYSPTLNYADQHSYDR